MALKHGDRLRIGVLISGRGSNLQALIDACAEPNYPAEISLVVSNKPEAVGLVRAQDAAITTQIINNLDFHNRDSFDRALHQSLCAADVSLVCLAGFMRLLSPEFCEVWRDRLINIHPSLLPSFKGLNAQAQAIAAGAKVSGCTVHFVRPDVDAGPTILQGEVPVLKTDDADRLSARILELEHKIYPRVVRLIAQRRVRVKNERVEIDGQVVGSVSN